MDGLNGLMVDGGRFDGGRFDGGRFDGGRWTVDGGFGEGTLFWTYKRSNLDRIQVQFVQLMVSVIIGKSSFCLFKGFDKKTILP